MCLKAFGSTPDALTLAMIILVQYVDNRGIHYNCRDLVDDFYAAVRDDGHINLNFVGDLTWCLDVLSSTIILLAL